MKTLYLDCSMGASGDMLMSALVELHPNPDIFVKSLNNLGIPGVLVERQSAVKCGITGTHIEVSVHGQHENEQMHAHPDLKEYHYHEHHHTGMHEIEHIVSQFALPGKVKKDILAVYQLIAQAESKAHGCEIDQIHFHEVGTMDAVADITGVCMLIQELNPEKIVASPVHVGYGQVKCAHGILPVPAPATAYILRGIPIYGGSVQGELCTPTGAALLKHFVHSFGNMPEIEIEKIGYGMGTKDFDTANCLRVMLGETKEQTDQVLELCCNIDDMTAEEIGFATERILTAGALEVFTTAIGMKKNRPGILLSCLCKLAVKETVLAAMFQYTTTLGIREHLCNRYVLERTEKKLTTPYGAVRIKQSSGYGVQRTKTEYDDLAKIAEEQKISICEARRWIDKELINNGTEKEI